MQQSRERTHGRIMCGHKQILSLIAQHAENSSVQFHGLSASYNNFPWHTYIAIKPIKHEGIKRDIRTEHYR